MSETPGPFGPVLNRVRVAYARSAVPKFLSWWGGELAPLLPTRLREALADRSYELWAQFDGDRLRVQRAAAGRVQDLGQVALSDGREALQRLLERAAEDDEQGPPPVWLLLPASEVLLRRLQFPRAAMDNLARVLAYEMDRQTPFKADQVHFDYRIDPETWGERQIGVDLVVATRASVERALRQAQQLSLPLAGIACLDPHDDGSARMDVNLLPVERRARRDHSRLRINAILLAALLLGLFMVMQQSLQRREQALEALQQRVHAVRLEAQQVAELRSALEEAVQGANFLSDRRAERPPLTLVLAELTRTLPDDTWLEQLSYSGGRVTLQGHAGEATRLIELLQTAKTLRSPGFSQGVLIDSRTNRERFAIGADLAPLETEDADSSGAG